MPARNCKGRREYRNQEKFTLTFVARHLNTDFYNGYDRL